MTNLQHANANVVFNVQMEFMDVLRKVHKDMEFTMTMMTTKLSNNFS